MTLPWRTTLSIVVLTLLVWIAFWYAQAPVDAASTLVVALFVTVRLLLGQAIWSRLRRPKAAIGEKPQ
jgi:hypothetical protein